MLFVGLCAFVLWTYPWCKIGRSLRAGLQSGHVALQMSFITRKITLNICFFLIKRHENVV